MNFNNQNLDTMSDENKNSVVIIGAGPAGLTAAYELCRKDTESIVLEKDHIVGGLSRTDGIWTKSLWESKYSGRCT